MRRDRVRLAERLETAGKWAIFISLLLTVLAGATQCAALLVASFFFLAPAYLMPDVADWLRTRAALADVRSRSRAIPASTSTLPPRAVDPAIPRDPGTGQAGAAAGWIKPLIEWDSPSRSIH